MQEVLQIYPKDEERVKKNALQFYSKDKAEGSIAGFSTVSGQSEGQGSDESGSSDGKSRASRSSGNSGTSRSSGKSKSTDHSGSSNTRPSDKKKKGPKSVSSRGGGRAPPGGDEGNNDGVEADAEEGDSSEEGGLSSVDPLGNGGDHNDEMKIEMDTEDMPLMKETGGCLCEYVCVCARAALS